MGFFENEIKAAIEAELSGRKFVPMKGVAAVLRKHRDLVSQNAWNLIADFLEGKHRGKKGKRPYERQLDLDRVELILQYLDEGLSRTGAFERLMSREKLHDIRTIERIVARGLQYMKEDNEAMAIETRALELMVEESKRQLEEAEREMAEREKSASRINWLIP